MQRAGRRAEVGKPAERPLEEPGSSSALKASLGEEEGAEETASPRQACRKVRENARALEAGPGDRGGGQGRPSRMPGFAPWRAGVPCGAATQAATRWGCAAGGGAGPPWEGAGPGVDLGGLHTCK